MPPFLSNHIPLWITNLAPAVYRRRQLLIDISGQEKQKTGSAAEASNDCGKYIRLKKTINSHTGMPASARTSPRMAGI